MEDILSSKRILIVDDEPDILETLEEILDMCIVETAHDFKTASDCLNNNSYDVAILDIMGVKGYELLSLANMKGIPSLILTAYALSPDHLVKSIKSGAQYYVPKYKISEITIFLSDIIRAREKGIKKQALWFTRLKPFFDKQFGPGWREKHKKFWEEFDRAYGVKNSQ
jgi:DNA-binding response OmpR family regulator